MTYKIKSLIYLCCFVIAAFIYNGIEQDDKFQNQMNSSSVAETDFEDSEEQEEDLKDLEADLE